MRMLLRFCSDLPAGHRRLVLLRRTLAGFGLALIAATWRLWTPQQVFPQVPFVRWAGGLPDGFQWAAAAAMVAGLLAALLVRERWSATAMLVFAGSATALILVDQERLQPWAYQFVLVAMVLALADRRTAFSLLRLLIVSFYFHSALSKFDASFLQTLGQQFLSALGGVVGLSLESWSEPWRLRAATIFPAGELFVAVGLCFSRTRRIALLGALLLHALLLIILGPWGLQHRLGVLIWNLYFMVQDVLLFWGDPRRATVTEESAEPPVDPRGVAWLAVVAMVAAMFLPLLAPTAWFDLWPSWGLYASSAERVSLLVHRREWGRLPLELQACGESQNDPDDPWIPLRLDRWALAALDAPIYPQARSQLGVAEAVIGRYGLGHRARVVRSSLADRFSGERRHELLTGLPQLLAAQDEYWLNAHPRQGALPEEKRTP